MSPAKTAVKASRRPALAAAVLVLAACESPYAGIPEDAPRRPVTPPPATATVRVSGETPAEGWEGWVVWESSRGGAWRLWIRDLALGEPPRRLSPDEVGRQHCCPHVAPGGAAVAYLSLPPGQELYPKTGAAGPLHLVRPDGSGDRVLVDEARTYAEHRAVVWLDAHRFAYIDASGRTRLYDLGSGPGEVVLDEPSEAHGWLVDPTLTYATTGWPRPSFSEVDRARHRVKLHRQLGGCQPYFSQDGRWGYWVAGAGGPIRAVELATRRTSTILAKSDPRLPEPWGYLYFPMLSKDGRLLAWAASQDEHSHHTSNYDVFVARTDPATLTVLGDVRRITDDPATDRFPDVYAKFLPPAPPSIPAPSPPGERVGVRGGYGVRGPSAWPSNPRGLLYRWQTELADNTAKDPDTGETRNSLVEPRGRAFFDRHYRMTLRGGAFDVDDDSTDAVYRGARKTNEFALEAWITPAPGQATEAGWIVTFSNARRQRNFSLGQEGDRLVFRIRTGTTGPNADRPQLDLGKIPRGEPSHVVVSYTPGLLTAFVNGEPVLESEEVQSGFFPWKMRQLLFGNEGGPGGRPWHGAIEGVAIYNRTLDREEAAQNFRLYRGIVAGREPVETLEVEARLERRSRIPTPAEISPYRDALAVFEYRAGERTLRVVHRVLLDGERTPVSGRAVGNVYRLVLEPFFEQPQLENLFLQDDFGGEGKLYYSPKVE